MVSFLCEACPQGIMVVVFISLDWVIVLMNKNYSAGCLKVPLTEGTAIQQQLITMCFLHFCNIALVNCS